MRLDNGRVWVGVWVSLVVATPQVARADDDKDKGYPTASIERPLTLPKGMFQASFGFGNEHVGAADPANAQGSVFSTEYAATGSVQAKIDTGITVLPDFTWNKKLAVALALRLIDTKRIDLAPSVGLATDFTEDPVTGDRTLLRRVEAGLVLRVAVGRVWVQVDGGPPGPGAENLLTVDLQSDPKGAIALNLGVGAGFQVNEQFAASLTTRAVHAQLRGAGESAWLLVDGIPVSLRALYGLNKTFDGMLDISVVDVTAPGDYNSVIAGINLRL